MNELEAPASSISERLAPIREEDEGPVRAPPAFGWRDFARSGMESDDALAVHDEVPGKSTHDYVAHDDTSHRPNPFSGPAQGSSSSPPMEGSRMSRVASPRRDILRPGSSPLHRSFTPSGHPDLPATGDLVHHSDLNDRVMSDHVPSDSESDPEHQQRGRPRRLSHLALSHPRPMSASTIHRLALDGTSMLRVPGQDHSGALGDDTLPSHANSPTMPIAYPPRALSSSPRRTTTPGGGSRSTSATGAKMVRQMSGVDSDITGPWFDHFARLTGNQVERLRAFKKSPMERRRNALIKAAHEVPGGWESLGPVIRKQMTMALEELATASKELGGRSKSTSQSPVPKPRDRSNSRSRLGDTTISPTGHASNPQAQTFRIETVPADRLMNKSRERKAGEERKLGQESESVERVEQKMPVRIESRPLQPMKTMASVLEPSAASTSSLGGNKRPIERAAGHAATAGRGKPRFKLNVVPELPAASSASASSGTVNGISRRPARSSRADSTEPLQMAGRRLRQRRNLLDEVDLESNDEDDSAMREAKRMARSAEAYQSRLSDSFNRVKEASYVAAIDSLAVSLESVENETHPAFVAELKKLKRRREQRHAAARQHLLLAERSVSATVKCERKLGRDTFKYAAHELRQKMHDDVIKKRNGIQEVTDGSRANFGPHCGAWFRNENDQTTFGWDTQKHEWSSFLPESWRDDLDADLTICRSVEAGGTMAAQKAAELAARRYRERDEAELAMLKQTDSANTHVYDRKNKQLKRSHVELAPSVEPVVNDAASQTSGGRARKLSKKAQEAAEASVEPARPSLQPVAPKKSTVSMDKLLDGPAPVLTSHPRKERTKNDAKADTKPEASSKGIRPRPDLLCVDPNGTRYLIHEEALPAHQRVFGVTGTPTREAPHDGIEVDNGFRKKVKKNHAKESTEQKPKTSTLTEAPKPFTKLAGASGALQTVEEDGHVYLNRDLGNGSLPPSESYHNHNMPSRPLQNSASQTGVSHGGPHAPSPYDNYYNQIPSQLPQQQPVTGLRAPQQGHLPSQEHYYKTPAPLGGSYAHFGNESNHHGHARGAAPTTQSILNPAQSVMAGPVQNGLPAGRYAPSGPSANVMFDGSGAPSMMTRMPSMGEGSMSGAMASAPFSNPAFRPMHSQPQAALQRTPGDPVYGPW